MRFGRSCGSGRCSTGPSAAGVLPTAQPPSPKSQARWTTFSGACKISRRARSALSCRQKPSGSSHAPSAQSCRRAPRKAAPNEEPSNGAPADPDLLGDLRCGVQDLPHSGQQMDPAHWALGGIFLITGILLIMNYNHPFTKSARIYFTTSPIMPTVKGRVTEVPVEPNVPLDVLFRLDPRPYQYAVDQKKILLAEAEQVAVYTPFAHHWAIIRRILLRMRSWENFVFLEGH